MDFECLDSNFTLVSNLPATNMQWTRKLYEVGEFTCEVRAADYNPDWWYIWNKETNEVAAINSVIVDNQGDGFMVTLRGYFVEFWLTRGCVLNDLSTETNVITACRDLINNRVINDLGLNHIVIGDLKSSTTKVNAYPENETEVNAITQKLLKDIEYAQKLNFNYAESKFYYEIFQGIDRTQQDQYRCVFSESLGSITGINYEYDDSNYKNYAEIKISRGGDPERFMFTEYDWRKPGEATHKIRVDVSESDSDITDAQAIKDGQEKGKLELLNHRIVETVSFTPDETFFTYLKDYDLGDKIKLVTDILAMDVNFRITEVEELYKNGHREISLNFGEQKIINYGKGRL